MLLSVWVVPAGAQDAEMTGLHCGDVVTITASPEVGYRFVQWSDGNTDNPREIEITQAVSLSAEYAPICHFDLVPVVWLYDQLLMVNADSLQRMGYAFSPQSVTWYQIVDNYDVTSYETNDRMLATGYFYNLLPGQTGAFYAAVDISATPPASPPRCTDILYSTPVLYGSTDLNRTEEDNDADNVQKILYNNRLYILRGKQVYRADGREVGEEEVESVKCKVESSRLVE